MYKLSVTLFFHSLQQYIFMRNSGYELHIIKNFRITRLEHHINISDQNKNIGV